MIICFNGIFNTNIKPSYSDNRIGDVKHSLANIGKAMQFLDYKPKYSFIDGLHISIDAIR